MISFDVICPAEGNGLSPFVDVAERKKVKTFGVLSPTDATLSILFDLSVPDEEGSEPVLCLFFFPYENRVWNLSDKTEFRSLLARFGGDVEQFLLVYKAVCKQAILATDCRLVFGLEPFLHFPGKENQSSVYRKTMLDLTDLLVKRGQAVGYAAKHPIFDLSPCVLRRLAELRGDLLPASFAKTPDEIGKGIESTLLSARAAGLGSYLTYTSSGWESRPIVSYKENL